MSRQIRAFRSVCSGQTAAKKALPNEWGAATHAGTATWRSGYAAVCKTVYTSSILVVASTLFQSADNLCGQDAGRAGQRRDPFAPLPARLKKNPPASGIAGGPRPKAFAAYRTLRVAASSIMPAPA